MDTQTAVFWVAVALVTITSAARITRLLTYDEFPPSVWVRMQWDKLTHDNGYALLVHCGYCASFWITLIVLGVGELTDYHPVWWFVNGVFGASYLAAILMSRDGDDD